MKTFFILVTALFTSLCLAAGNQTPVTSCNEALTTGRDWIVSGQIYPPLIDLAEAGTMHKMSFAGNEESPIDYPGVKMRITRRKDVGSSSVQALMSQLIAKARLSQTEWLLLVSISAESKVTRRWIKGTASAVNFDAEIIQSFIRNAAQSTRGPFRLFVIHNHSLGPRDHPFSHPAFSMLDIETMRKIESLLALQEWDIMLRFIVVPDGILRGVSYEDVFFEVISTFNFPD